MNSLLRDKGESILPISAPEPEPIVRAGVDFTLKYFLIYLLTGFPAALGFSYFLSRFNATPHSGLLMSAASMGALFLMILLFQTFCVRSFYFNLILVLLHTAGLLGFFLPRFSFWFILGGLAFIFFWTLAFYKGNHELNDGLKVNFWRYSNVTLVKLITGLALLIAFVYAGVYARANALSYQAFKFTIANIPGVEYAVPNFIPTIDTDIAAKDSGDIRARANESIIDYTYRLALIGIEYLKAHGLGFLIVAAIIMLVYFGIKGIMFFIQWPLLVISLMIYFALLSIGAVTIEGETRQKEVAVIH